MSDPTALGAAELESGYRDRSLSPVELVRATIDKIERLNPRFNAYRLVDAEAALAAARESESRWQRGAPLSPIDGVTFGVKDILLARGHATLFGSRAVSAEQDTSQDAPAVARLREDGAIFLGKTNTSEFGWKGTADNTLTGITRNPWNPGMTTGGSSGGAAAAAATGLGVFQLGTDGGGSVRIPASFTGLFGMKATFGRIGAWPAGPMMTLSNVGPITRSVDDGARMLAAITRRDPRDWYALPECTLDFSPQAEASLRGQRLGLYLGSSAIRVDAEIVAAVAALGRTLEAAGAIVSEVALPIDELQDVFMAHWYAGALHLVTQIPEARRELVDPGLLAHARRGAALTLPEHYRATFLRQRAGEALQAAIRPFDAIITPTVPIVAFEAGREWPQAGSYESWTEWARLVYPFNLSRQPAASLPVALSASGLPIGAQLVGALYEDQKVVALARAIERLLPRIRLPAQ